MPKKKEFLFICNYSDIKRNYTVNGLIIDELSKNLPDIPKDNLSSEQELQLLSYIEKLNDPSFKQIEIDLEKQIISIKIEDLSIFKLQIIKEAMKQLPLSVDDSSLVEQNNAFFGSLIIRYKNE